MRVKHYDAFVIKLLSTGEEQRWTNASFVAVLTGESLAEEPCE